MALKEKFKHLSTKINSLKNSRSVKRLTKICCCYYQKTSKVSGEGKVAQVGEGIVDSSFESND